MNINIESENHHIIENGTVCTFKGDPLTIKFGPDLELSVILKFTETESKEQGHKVKNIDSKTLKLELINFNNSLGTGNIDPMDMGTLGEKKLFFNFRIYALGGSKTKLIHYTIYQEK